MLSAEIIAIGSELLTPQFHDTNSTFLTEQLNLIGIAVKVRTIVGDEEVHLEHTLRAAMERTEIVVTIGGLGPTEDDITRKVVAQATDRRLILDDKVLAKLAARFRERGVRMSSNNERQALVPSDAEVLDNSNGTAPGLWLSTGKNTLILLPGPPAELRPMFEKHCCPRLVQMSGPLALARQVFRTTGLGESMLDSRIAPIYTKYKNPATTVLSKPGQVDIRLTARAKTSAEAEAILAEVGDEIDKTLGEYIFTRDEQTLEEVVGMYLVMKGATVAVAESCTGGMLAERLTSVPGSSQFFQSGIVVYSNESKIDLAGIPPLVARDAGRGEQGGRRRAGRERPGEGRNDHRHRHHRHRRTDRRVLRKNRWVRSTSPSRAHWTPITGSSCFRAAGTRFAGSPRKRRWTWYADIWLLSDGRAAGGGTLVGRVTAKRRRIQAARGRSLMARVTATSRQMLGAAPTAMRVHR